MKRILLVLFVAALAFIWVNRMRVFVRDPLATVSKCKVATGAGEDCVAQSGAQVYINYANDVLLEQDSGPVAYRTLVQGWNKMPGAPKVLQCLRWMACMTDAEQASTFPVEWDGKGKYDPQVTMTNRVVTFTAGDGTAMRVVLR